MESYIYKLSLLLDLERHNIRKCLLETSKKNNIDPFDAADILIKYYEEKEIEEQEKEVEKLQDVDIEELDTFSDEDYESKSIDYQEFEKYEREKEEALQRNKELIARSRQVGFKNIIRALERLKLNTNLSKEDRQKVYSGRQALIRKIAKYVSVPQYYSKEFTKALFDIVIKYAEDSYEDYLIRREFALVLISKDEPMYVIAMIILSRSPTQQELGIFYELALIIKDDIVQVSNKTEKLKYIIKILMKYGNSEFRKRVMIEFTKSQTAKGKIREIYDIIDEDVFA